MTQLNMSRDLFATFLKIRLLCTRLKYKTEREYSTLEDNNYEQEMLKICFSGFG